MLQELLSEISFPTSCTQFLRGSDIIIFVDTYIVDHISNPERDTDKSVQLVGLNLTLCEQLKCENAKSLGIKLFHLYTDFNALTTDLTAVVYDTSAQCSGQLADERDINDHQWPYCHQPSPTS